MANGGKFPDRWDRLTPKIFKGKTFEAEVVESQNRDRAEISGNASCLGEYKIRRLIRLLPDKASTETHLAYYKQGTDSHRESDGNVTAYRGIYAPHNGNEAVYPHKRDTYTQNINKGMGSTNTPDVAPRANPSPSLPSARQGRDMTDRLKAYGIVIEPVDQSHAETVYVTCPECSAQRKKSSERCLSVDVIHGTWKCFHCSWQGNLPIGAIRQSQVQATAHATINDSSCIGLPALQKGHECEALLAFMALRGVSEAVIDRNAIELKIDRNGRGWVNFPYRRYGRYVYSKSRGYDRKEFRHFKAGASQGKAKITPILYNEDALRLGVDWVVMVEGELDALAVQTAGIENVVSVPTGAGERNCEWLGEVLPEFLHLRCVVLAVDRDEKGQELAQTLKRVLEEKVRPDLCQFLKWEAACDCAEDEKCKDANDILLKHGRETLTRAITEAAMQEVGALAA